MSLIDTVIGVISFLTIGVRLPKTSKDFKRKKLDSMEDTREFFLETQRLSSSILRTLNPSALKEKKELILSKVKQRYQKINKNIHTSGFIKRRDKLVFMTTIINLVFASTLLGSYPCYFHYYYIACALTLIPTRFVNYRMQKYHYFLLDFCYYANILTVIYLYGYPTSQMLYNISFAFACGPLLIAVPLFTNSFVPHSIDRMTSLVIHLLPSITLWAMKTANCSEHAAAMEPYGLVEFSAYAALTYFAWIVPYYVIIFCLASERVQRKQNITLYHYAMANGELTKRYCGMFGERFRPLMFMLQHALSSMILVLLAYVQIRYYWVFTGFVAVISCWSIWNGAGYYIDLFARRYEKDLQRIEEIYQNLA